MPFLSYQVTRRAKRSATPAGCCRKAAPRRSSSRAAARCSTSSARLVDVGIPVMGHLGLTPQSVHQIGGYRGAGHAAAGRPTHPRRRARRSRRRAPLRSCSKSIPARARAHGSRRELAIPTIGIGAGPDCDGQVLVSYDMLGLFDRCAVLRQAVRAARRRDRRGDGGVHRGRARRPLPGGARQGGLRTHDVRWRAELVESIATSSSAPRRQPAEPTPRSGLVPTMGALHAGHVRLIEQARRECQAVVVSIFVNPLQFDREDDLAALSAHARRRPRSSATGSASIVVFAPSVDEMYPAPPECTIDVGRLADHLCGEYRPGHFRGVATVVMKLFGSSSPTARTSARRTPSSWRSSAAWSRDLNVPVQIVGVPTVREPDGLALSSRNAQLGPAERQSAIALFRALQTADRQIAGWRHGCRTRETHGRGRRFHATIRLSGSNTWRLSTPRLAAGHRDCRPGARCGRLMGRFDPSDRQCAQRQKRSASGRTLLRLRPV